MIIIAKQKYNYHNMAFETIHDFFINISKNNLIICDIDETILTRHMRHKKKSKSSKQHITLNKIKSLLPSYTHKKSFLHLLEEIERKGCKLIFLTARPKSLEQITILQFDYLKLDYYAYDTHYVYNYNKGKYVKHFIDYSPFERVIFIDDKIQNLIHMKTEIKNCICYHFKYLPQTKNKV